MYVSRLLIAAAAASLATVAHAQAGGPGAAAAADSASTPASAALILTEGEVRKVDAAQGTVTLKHGRIENLDMPGMTMVFHAATPKLLEGLHTGDKVKFHAEQPGDVLTVTSIQHAG